MFNNNNNNSGMQFGNLDIKNIINRLKQMNAIRAFQEWMSQPPQVYDTTPRAQKYYNSAQGQLDRMKGYGLF